MAAAQSNSISPLQPCLGIQFMASTSQSQASTTVPHHQTTITCNSLCPSKPPHLTVKTQITKPLPNRPSQRITHSSKSPFNLSPPQASSIHGIHMPRLHHHHSTSLDQRHSVTHCRRSQSTQLLPYSHARAAKLVKPPRAQKAIPSQPSRSSSTPPLKTHRNPISIDAGITNSRPVLLCTHSSRTQAARKRENRKMKEKEGLLQSAMRKEGRPGRKKERRNGRREQDGCWGRRRKKSTK